MEKKKIVVLTGAGISAESGIRTFRGTDGLWENHSLMELANPNAWARDPELVLRFYNERRALAAEAQPNAGHLALVELEKYFDVHIITQNVDNLHERAGSSKVLHLHGELSKARSTIDANLTYEYGGKPIKLGDLCELGSQLRPHIVWFGESVRTILPAIEIAKTADVFLVIGTSMVVYPAASLIDDVPSRAWKYVIDPNIPPVTQSSRYQNVTEIPENATVGVPKVVQELIAKFAA